MSLYRLSLLLLLFSLSGCLQPALQLRGGTLAGDQQWQGRVDIFGDVELLPEARLTIAPGCEIVFHPAPASLDNYQQHPHFVGSELIVRGRLRAIGTSAAPIVFRHLDPTAPAGSWGGINIMDGAVAEVAYARFQSADSALHIQESSIQISHSTFRNNLVGVRFHSSKILLTDSLFDSNDTGVRFHFGAPLIRGNDFSNNRKSLFITSYPQDYRITGNRFLSARSYHVVLGEEVPEDVDLSGNWWGGLQGDALEATLFDGRREAYLGKVIYQPVLSRAPFTVPPVTP